MFTFRERANEVLIKNSYFVFDSRCKRADQALGALDTSIPTLRERLAHVPMSPDGDNIVNVLSWRP
jgi:hypothetical protein